MLYSSAHAQVKWYKPSKQDYIGYSLMTLSGIVKGYNQAIVHHHWGIGHKFWDNETSWQRKYKRWPEDQSAAFFGSKGVFVIFTDGSHLTEAINTTFTIGGTGFLVWGMKDELKNIPKRDRWKYVVFRKILLPLALRTAAFEITFKNLHR